MILENVELKLWKPVKVSQAGPVVSHFFFSDDLMLFNTVEENQISVVRDILSDFSKASGLQVNLDKSKLLLSPNVPIVKARSLSRLCEIPLT